MQDTIVEKVLKHPKYAELVQRRTRVSMAFFCRRISDLFRVHPNVGLYARCVCSAYRRGLDHECWRIDRNLSGV